MAKTFINNGSGFNQLKRVYIKNPAVGGYAWSDVFKMYMHDGNEWRLVFSNEWNFLSAISGASQVEVYNGDIYCLINGASGGIYQLVSGTWTKLGSLSNCSRMAFIGGTLYAQGSTFYTDIYSWNGSTWTRLVNTTAFYMSYCSDILSFNGNMTVRGTLLLPIGGGRYSQNPGVYVFSSGSWTKIGDFGVGSNPGLMVYGTGLAATSGGVYLYNGSTWQQLGTIYQSGKLVEFDGKIVCFGTLSPSGGAIPNGCFSWDGSAWTIVGDSIQYVGATFAFNNFLTVSATSPYNGRVGVYLWNGSLWEEIGEKHSGGSSQLFGYSGKLSALDSDGIRQWDA